MFDNEMRDAKIKDLQYTVGELATTSRINENDKREIYSLLYVFGIYRGCNNCKHAETCVVKESRKKYVDTYNVPADTSLCDKKYWERKV